jgi:hypothetical protein
LRKAATACQDPSPRAKRKRKLQEKQRLTEQTSQLDPGPTKKSPVGPRSVPIKEKMIRIEKLDPTPLETRANSPG